MEDAAEQDKLGRISMRSYLRLDADLLLRPLVGHSHDASHVAVSSVASDV